MAGLVIPFVDLDIGRFADCRDPKIVGLDGLPHFWDSAFVEAHQANGDEVHSDWVR